MTPPRKIGLFPGTFDPITNGHLDVVRRGQKMFDELIVAIGHNPEKQQLFTMEQRHAMIRQLLAEECDGHVRVESFRGLTVDFAREMNATAILRGIRNVTDLNAEFRIALTNRAIADIETVFIMTGDSYAFTSSTLIKQIAAGGGVERLGRLLPQVVIDHLKEKIDAHGGQFPWPQPDHLKEDG